MKILVLASNYFAVTPDCITAPERVASDITEGLLKNGHEVILAASGDSKTSAELFSVTKQESVSDANIGQDKHIDYEFMLIKEAIALANKRGFDLIHSHFDTRTAIFADSAQMPVVSTLHSPITNKIAPILERYKDNQCYISISNSQRAGAPDLGYIATVYHGIDIKTFDFSPSSKTDLLIVGRVVPEKGFDTAIRIARSTGKKLQIIGRVGSEHRDYFENKIHPHIDGKDITLNENMPYQQVKKMLPHSKILLFPIDWEEPFGLVMIEAMACGTPVVAYNRGSVPEIIKDGVTGFIVPPGNISAMTKAVQKIYDMPEKEYQEMRQACRQHVEDNFTVGKMVDGYEKVYQKVIDDWRKKHAQT